jgi:hypothetical protein
MSSSEVLMLKSWIKSISGLATLLLLFGALLSWFTGFQDIALFLAICDLILSIVGIVSEKRSQLSHVRQRLEAYQRLLTKVATAEFEPIGPLVARGDPKYKDTWVNWQLQNKFDKFLTNASLLPDDLLCEGITSWLWAWLPKGWIQNTSIRDFMVYAFLRENFAGYWTLLKQVEAQYSDLDSILKDPSKQRFLALLYSYFLRNKKSLNDLYDAFYHLDDPNRLREAYYFLTGAREQVREIRERFEQALTEREKLNYFLKLTDQLRQHLQSRGVSLEKFGEAYLSGMKNAYVVFTAEKSGKNLIKQAIRSSSIPRADLYFTGPHILFPEDSVNNAEELKRILFSDLSKDYSHVLLIARLLPADIKLSSENLTPPLERIARKLTLIGSVSDSVQKYLTILDILPKDFLEKVSLDFLILDVREDEKLVLRHGEDQLREAIKQSLHIQVAKLTDYSKIGTVDGPKLATLLEQIGIGNKVSRAYANKIVEGATKWRFIIYGSPMPEILTR